MNFFKISSVAVTSCMVAIIGTGLLLKVAGEGKLGNAAKDFAQSVTKGYGV